MSIVLASLAALPAEFRGNAAEVRRLGGAEGAATAWEEAARQTELRLREARLEPLTLDAAVAESGYTRNHLNRLMREGTLPNSGTDSNPRILRTHVPRKPGFAVDQQAVQPASSRVQAARAVIEGDN